MIDKIIKLVKSQSAYKRVCTFFLAFVATLAVMGGNHEIFYGSSAAVEPEKAPTVKSAVTTTENRINSVTTLDGRMEQQLAESLIYAAVKKPKAKIGSVGEEDGTTAKSDTADADEKVIVKKTSAKDSDKDADKTEKKKKKAGDAEADGFKYSKKIPMSRELQEYTYQKCAERGLEYELILAIIWRESGFNADAVNVNTNGTRDNGIMQINDVNRQWLHDKHGITDLMDPYQNIDAGTTMLGGLTEKYGAHNAMLAYQYGEGGMANKLKQGITTSTAIEKAYKQRDYYRKIIA